MPSVEGFLTKVEQRSAVTSASLDASARSARGQFFTPRASASLLASMLPCPTEGWRLIDPGAGIGSLTAALVARWLTDTELPVMSVLAYEVDQNLIEPLEATLAEARGLAASCGRELRTTVRNENFVVRPPMAGAGNVVLMNPPYKKLSASSDECAVLLGDQAPVRVTNLYAAFLVRAVRVLEDGGELVAITPRSFANGPYFRALRSELLTRACFRRIHVFETRDRVFADAGVLQENLVFSMHVGVGTLTDIEITTSRDALGDVTTATRRQDQVIHPDDRQRFVRLPLDDEALVVADRMAKMPCALQDLGCMVSTGRVVDFRVREHLRDTPNESTAPLVYPQNIRGGVLEWPVITRKPQALVLGGSTANLLLPNEHYVVVKRFSAKEEARRVVAAAVRPEAFAGAGVVAYENHLNVFHVSNRGLDAEFAVGLAAYLNSRFVDDYVRQFSGHTQVNATDLRELRYPTPAQLRALGMAAGQLSDLVDPDALDELLGDVIAPPRAETLAIAA